MALTLVEAAKNEANLVRSAVIEMYARTNPVLRVLPFDDIAGNSITYAREHTLPGVGFRGVNESYTESTGIINPLTEVLKIAGGDVAVDRFITGTMGPGKRESQEMMKVKALALRWGLAFIKGNSASEPREFDGLQVRISGNQLIAAGASAGGDVLSLLKVDELIDAVDEPTHLVMSKAMRRTISAAARDTTVGGFVTYGKDEFGVQLTMYNDLPILALDEDNSGNQILDFNEANPGGGSNVGTSIYCVSLMSEKLTGIQNGTIDVRDLGETTASPQDVTRVEWYSGIAVWHGRAAARLHGIKAGAATK